MEKLNNGELNIKRVLKNSFECIAKNISRNNVLENNNVSDGDKHKERSKAWIDQICIKFQDHYGKEHVFWRNYDNKYFSYKEILYDIVISEIGYEKSPTGKDIFYLRYPIWQIECEFAKFENGRLRDIFQDFGKLVIGSAPNKLFIGSQPKNENYKEHYKQIVLNIARSCRNTCAGKVYFALIPHPEKWGESKILDGNPVEVWKLTEIWTPMVE